MKRDAIAYLGLLGDANVRAFWHMIRVGEGTADEDGYRRLFGGEVVDDLADHPRRAVTRKLGGKPITSTAAGAAQFLSRTWDECAQALGLRDFSPRSQDAAALFLIDRRKALEDVIAGRFESAVRKCNREWASLPESPYGQPVKTMAQARATYQAAGGTFAPEAAAPTPHRFSPDTMAALGLAPEKPTGEQTMPLAPILTAVLPSIVAAIPQLGKLFGSGSEVAERNVKAAEVAVNIVKDAVGAKNAQEAAEIVASDPAAAQVAREAVTAQWHALTEAGGGGIEGARKADQERMAGSDRVRDIFKSHSFWIALALLPLVYIIVLSVIGVVGSATWSDDVRASIAGLIVGTIVGGLMGYYFGQTTSRNRSGPAPS